MNRLRRIILILFILAGTATACAETGAVELTTGTTFLVSHDGYLLTNYHVVEGCKSIAVYLRTSNFTDPSSLAAKMAVRLRVLLQTPYQPKNKKRLPSPNQPNISPFQWSAANRSVL